jgi:hypothetical protein
MTTTAAQFWDTVQDPEDLLAQRFCDPRIDLSVLDGFVAEVVGD